MRFLPSISLLFLTFLFLLSTSRSEAQNQNNNYGKEFRFTFLENYGSLDKVSFVVSLTKLPDTFMWAILHLKPLFIKTMIPLLVTPSLVLRMLLFLDLIKAF